MVYLVCRAARVFQTLIAISIFSALIHTSFLTANETMALSKQANEDVLRQMTSDRSVKEYVESLMAPFPNYESFLTSVRRCTDILGRFLYVMKNFITRIQIYFAQITIDQCYFT